VSRWRVRVGFSVPLSSWNELANHLALQRIPLTYKFAEQLTTLRSLEPTYRDHREHVLRSTAS
jgi:hypothetical protein